MSRVLVLVGYCFIIATLSSCSSDRHAVKPGFEPESRSNMLKEEKPSPQGHSALETLSQAGLMTKKEYSSAEYIPNSQKTMIIADVAQAPCRMIFRFITTDTGAYWMPDQISCAP